MILTDSENRTDKPFSLSVRPLTALVKLSYVERDFAKAGGPKRGERHRRGGGRVKIL